MTARLSINLPDEYMAKIRQAAVDEGRPITEVVRRAFTVYDLLMSEGRAGNALKIVDPSGAERTLTIL